MIRLEQTSRFAHARLPTHGDFRHVVVTRNFVDAIVSGYLYHKAGHECWLDNFGNRKKLNRTSTDWHVQLTFHNDIPYPPRNSRSLCSYLEQESEEDGMRVLMDVALSGWYKGVVPYYNKVQEWLQTNHEQRSLFICFEDLVDPFQQEEIYREILNWLFPGQDMNKTSMPEKAKVCLEQQQRNQTRYSGGHSTVKDGELRARLRGLVERLDRQVFRNTVAQSNAIFGCGILGTKS